MRGQMYWERQCIYHPCPQQPVAVDFVAKTTFFFRFFFPITPESNHKCLIKQTPSHSSGEYAVVVEEAITVNAKDAAAARSSGHAGPEEGT